MGNMSSEQTRAVLYARISEDSTGEGAGVERQQTDARKLAADRGWEVVAEYVDNDLSALRGAHRPGYAAMLDRIRAGGVDRVVVWQTSRLWRNREERARDIGTLADHRCGVFAVKGPDLDLNTAYGRGMAGLLGEFDTMESEVKGERVAAAAAARARSGKPNGSLGYGWRRDDSGSWVVLPEEAAVVADVVDRLIRGETLASVTQRLNDTGVPPPGAAHNIARRAHGNPTGSTWGKTSVRKLALRPSNAALRIHHRGQPDEATYPGAWPALIPVEKWEAVTARLTAPGRGRTSPGHRRHLLSWGVGYCGVCDSVLRVSVKGNARAELYVCDARGCVGRNKAALDSFVRGLAVGRLAMPDALEAWAGDTGAGAEASTRLRTLRDRLDLAADSYAEGRITVEQLARVTDRLRPEIEAAERDVARARPGAPVDLLREVAGERAGEAWDRLQVSQQRAIVETLFASVKVNRVERRGPGFDPASVEITWRAS